ncbi:hypothetical protein ACE38W_16170 [Chitinophaga sp. Hz27]|uniref:hypothetical protein n=1 Tax=Chitinophaga sp. Hz27 TaxID=3347169 RepID=UPI0035E2A2A8
MKQIMLIIALSLLITAPGNGHSLSTSNKISKSAAVKRATIVTITVSLITPGVPSVTAWVENLNTGQKVNSTLNVAVPPTATAKLSVSVGDVVKAYIQVLGASIGTTHTVTGVDIANGGFHMTI